MARGTTLRNVRVGHYLWHLSGLVTARRKDDRSKVMVGRLEAYTKRYATDEDRAAAAAYVAERFPDEVVETDQ